MHVQQKLYFFFIILSLYRVTEKSGPMKYLENKTFEKKIFHIKVVEFQ